MTGTTFTDIGLLPNTPYIYAIRGTTATAEGTFHHPGLSAVDGNKQSAAVGFPTAAHLLGEIGGQAQP